MVALSFKIGIVKSRKSGSVASIQKWLCMLARQQLIDIIRVSSYDNKKY